MSGIDFNNDALRKLTNEKVAVHVKKKADELTDAMRDEAFNMQRAGHRGIIRAKFDVIVQNKPIAPATTEIGLPEGQIDSRPGNRRKSFAQYLAEKAANRDARSDSWIGRAIRKHGYFKRRG